MSYHRSADESSETASISSHKDVPVPPKLAAHAGKSVKSKASPVNGTDIVQNVRTQHMTQAPKPTRRLHKKATSEIVDENDEPVIDQTASLPLHSKKTERLQRRQQKRCEKLAYQRSITTSLLSLPGELLAEIFAYLLPTEIVPLLLTNRALHMLINDYESTIARNIIRRRYWILQRCFHLPVPFSSVPSDIQPALLSSKRQEMLNIHRKPYLHVQTIDPDEICTCLTCIFAWNNLCLIIDLHHWQPHLENREPLPIVPRGFNPQWNRDLLRFNADLVRTAMARPIVYAHILQMHLDTITRTIQRTSRWRRKVSPSPPTATTTTTTPPIPTRSSTTTPTTTATTPTSSSLTSSAKPLLYDLTTDDVASGTDAFLERKGPPSYDFPYMRDIYYSLEAYLPNRRWDKEAGRWLYNLTPLMQHQRDLEWVKSWAERVGNSGGGGGHRRRRSNVNGEGDMAKVVC